MSSSVHLVFLVVCFVLAYYNLWPSWHHKKINNFSPAAQGLIRKVVNDNWGKLLDSTRDLIDARLEDGGQIVTSWHCNHKTFQDCFIFPKKLKPVRKYFMLPSQRWWINFHLPQMKVTIPKMIKRNKGACRFAKDLPCAWTKKENNEKRSRPARVSEALNTLWLPGQGSTILYLDLTSSILKQFNELYLFKNIDDVPLTRDQPTAQPTWAKWRDTAAALSQPAWARRHHQEGSRSASSRCTRFAAKNSQLWLVHVLIYQVIGLPLGLVALDMGSDGNLLFFMNSYLDTIRAQNTKILPNNSTNNNFTVQHYNSLIEAGRLEVVGEALFIGSCLIIGFSLLSLILENPAKTLIRSVRTSALMRSKEMNAKDLPVPIGNVVFIQWTLILFFV